MRKIDEIFNQYIDLSIKRKGKDFIGTFSSDNDTYTVTLSPVHNALIRFSDNRYKVSHQEIMASTLVFGGLHSGIGISGAGQASLVFSSVGKIIMKFIEMTNPPAITFTASEPSRKKLYKALSEFLETKTKGEYVYVNNKEWEGGSFFLLKKKFFNKMKESSKVKIQKKFFESSEISSKKEVIDSVKFNFFITKPKKFDFKVDNKNLTGLFSVISYDVSKKDYIKDVIENNINKIHSFLHKMILHSLLKEEEKGYIYTFKIGDTKENIISLFEKSLSEVSNLYVFVNKKSSFNDKYVILLKRDLYNKWLED